MALWKKIRSREEKPERRLTRLEMLWPNLSIECRREDFWTTWWLLYKSTKNENGYCWANERSQCSIFNSAVNRTQVKSYKRSRDQRIKGSRGHSPMIPRCNLQRTSATIDRLWYMKDHHLVVFYGQCDGNCIGSNWNKNGRRSAQDGICSPFCPVWTVSNKKYCGAGGEIF
jgi:hypothetical protein